MAALTAADIAVRLGLTECTVRYYQRRFAAYIPVLEENGVPRYPPEALSIFREIAWRLRAGARVESVEAWLRHFAMTAEIWGQVVYVEDLLAPLIKAWRLQHQLEQENAMLREKSAD